MNPLYNTNDSPNNSTQPTKAVNRQGVSVPRSHNTFDMSYYNYMTMQFGKYSPFFVMEGVAGDKIPLKSAHDVRSLPMSSPFLSQLKLNKDFFLVPMQAILPNTWEYIFKTPSQGDDVPDDANCLFPLHGVDQHPNARVLPELIYQFNNISDDGGRLLWLLVLESIFSQGSLLAQLGCHFNPILVYNESRYSFDEWFDHIMLSEPFITFDLNGVSYSTEYDDSELNSEHVRVDLYQVLSILRSYGGQISNLSVVCDEIRGTVDDILNIPVFETEDDPGAKINLSRLFAYQLACSQFYVNPQVDYLYNAQLYRDNVFTLHSNAVNHLERVPVTRYFNMNGISVPYDYLSEHYITRFLRMTLYDDLLNSVQGIQYAFDWFMCLFGHRESLRFGDYFTDSRTRPLAVGSDNISVSSDNNISVVDVSKSIVYQRFRNAVVKLGNNFGDYLRGIFGTTPSPDYHYPKFISHQDFDISGFEVANSTSDGQGNLVTNLNTRDDTFQFDVEVDMPCVIIGIASFSVPRVYMQTKDRHFFHRNRYDSFNPMLQYIGDQIVYNIERTDSRPLYEIFGYQSRNNEYKQRYGVVSGGFATKLPAWTFVADSIFEPVVDVLVSNTQSPDFIRAHDYEFNRFFAALSGFSIANAFHYIVVFNNQCVCNRPMEINPNIL